MNISVLSLKRPVLAVVMSVMIVLFGIIGYTFLGVREYPAIDPPVITVRTNYTGASAEVIESQISEPLEKAINGVDGIRAISSSSSLGVSVITVEFGLSSDLEQAANDVRDKVSQAIRNLPQDIDAPPVVQKSDASGDPILFMPVQSTTRNVMELTAFAEDVLQERFQTIPGVSAVQVYGSRRFAMRLWIDPARMNAKGITVQDLKAALDRENVELPAGKVYGNKSELAIKSFGRLTTEEDFNNLIIREDAGGVIRMKDIGEAVLGPENEETSARRNLAYNCSVAIIPQPGANYVEIADEFYKRYNALKKDLPSDIIIDIAIDKTAFVRKSIVEVQETLVIAVILVIIIVFLFFRDWRTAFRPLIDIPVSLIGSFFIMYLFGFSINVLTMLAIVLATGLVVDDGIVVTENIYKKMEQGMDKWRAAREGSTEIFFAVLSTSITLVIVFIPVIFLQGFVGSLFREFGIVVAGAVMISAFVSLTLTPVLNVHLSGKNPTGHNRFYRWSEPFFVGLDNSYRATLQGFMRVRWIALVLVLACVGIILQIGKTIPTELAPLEDRSIIRAPVTAPEGTSFDYTEDIIMRLTQQVMDSVPEQRMIFGLTSIPFIGSGATNSGTLSIILPDPETRDRSQAQIAEQLGRMFKRFPEARVIPVQEQTISTGFRAGFALPVQFVIQNLNFEKLKERLPKFMEEVQKDPTFQIADINLKFNKPELNVTIDRLKSKELGVSVLDITNTLQLALSGRRFGYFLMNGKQYQVVGQVDRDNRDESADLKALYVRNARGELVQLDNLVRMEESVSPPQLFHYNRYKAATISASLAPGKTIGDGVTAMRAIADRVLDDTFATDLTGPSRDFAESSSNTSFAFILALVLVYLVLAAQFESFTDPFIIMITVPLALAGALLSLELTDGTLNIFSEIGMIMLVGLVTKNGILIVEFANQKREAAARERATEGVATFTRRELRQFVVEAAGARLRPILMTSLATILGALPIALALGAGAQSRIPLGVVVVGGLSFSLLLTLYVIPAMYSYLGRANVRVHEEG